MKKYKLTKISVIKHRVFELFLFFASHLLPNKKGKKVIIFGQGRSGSTLLESLVDSTGHFKKNGELLNNKKTERWFPFEYINGLRKISRQKNFIFHLKIYHLTTDRKKPVDPKKFLTKAVNNGWKIIFLHRENKVRQAISNLVAEQRGGFHKHNQSKEEIKLTIDLGRFERMVNMRFVYQEQEFELMSNLPNFKVVYEEDLLDNSRHTELIRGLIDFLGFEDSGIRPSTSHRKVNTSTLRELISNYDEFIECLKKNDWLHYISDEIDS